MKAKFMSGSMLLALYLTVLLFATGMLVFIRPIILALVENGAPKGDMLPLTVALSIGALFTSVVGGLFLAQIIYELKDFFGMIRYHPDDG